MKRWGLIVLILGCLTATGLAVAAKVRRDNARNLLSSMVAAEESGTYTAEVSLRYQRGDSAKSHRIRVIRVSGQTFTEPLDPSSERRPRWRHRGPITDVDLLLANYSVALEGEEPIAGRPARRVAVRPRHPDRPTCTLWIDRERSFLLKYETKDRTYETNAILFEAKAPERSDSGRSRGRREVSLSELPQAVSFPVAVPSWLPKGFRLQRASVMKWESHESLHLLYTDGLATLSVFESPEGSEWGRRWEWLKKKGGPCSAGKVSRGGWTTLTIALEGVVVTVAGSISEKELVDLLESMDVRRRG